MWTQFWDMHSGGGTKEAPYERIYIEAPRDEAEVIFYNRFGHNPNRVSCTCCGEDYSIDEHEDLAQLTGFHRNCRSLEVPRDPKTGLYQNDDPVIKRSLYLEAGEDPPEGYSISERWSSMRQKYLSLEEYEALDEVLIIRADDIKPEERVGIMPEQGYVWVD